MTMPSEEKMEEIANNLLKQTEEYSLGDRFLISLGITIGIVNALIKIAEETDTESVPLLKSFRSVQVTALTIFLEGRQRKIKKDIAESN